MCRKNFTFWYCAFLLAISSSKSQQNSTNNEEKNDNLTVRYELDENSTTNYDYEMKTLRYDLYEKSVNNTRIGYYPNMNNTQYDNRSKQYKSQIIFTNNDREDDEAIQYEFGMHSIQNRVDDKQISMELRMNLTNANHKWNFTSHEVYRNLISSEDKNDSSSHEFYENSNKDSNINNIIPYEMCYNITCIQLCCPPGDRLVDYMKCIPEQNKYLLPHVYGYTNNSLQSALQKALRENKRADELFQLTIYDPCQKIKRFPISRYDYMIFANGSLYLSYYKKLFELTSYCFAVLDDKDKYEVTICSEFLDKFDNIQKYNKNTKIKKQKIIIVSFHIVSISFLVLIFLVYSILPELRNTHGFLLLNYSGALSIARTIHIVILLIKADTVHYSVCISIAFFAYLCLLASFFWITVMSFNMWWTFRGFRPLQRNVRQRNKRKLVFYTIFAWGLPFIFAIISVIMDLVSEYLPEILRPGFHTKYCWFAERETLMLYCYGLESICMISNICLSISTTLRIAHYEKETGNRLTNSESKIYNDNKKCFYLYLKLFSLFIVIQSTEMSIRWSMMLWSWNIRINFIRDLYIINLMSFIQNLYTFVIFVWKKEIKRLLLKRFSGLFPKDRCARNTIVSTTSTCTITSEVISMQENSSCEQENCHAKSSSHGTEF